MRRIIQNGRAAFGYLEHSIYSWLPDRPPGLIVDAGAAAGYMTLAALKNSPQSRAIAFEPFPGNWPHLDKNLGGRGNVTIVKAALSDHVGEADFYVKSTVSPEQNWNGMPGYSSVGRIVEKIADPGKTIRVPTTTIDTHVSEPALFLKIDVQGHELQVLKGAIRTFERGVTAALIEYKGDPAILEFLFARGFAVYDSPYLLVPSPALTAPPDLSGWEIVKTGTSSTGHPVKSAWPLRHASDPAEFCAQFRSVRGVSIWTDLIAIARGVEA